MLACYLCYHAVVTVAYYSYLLWHTVYSYLLWHTVYVFAACRLPSIPGLHCSGTLSHPGNHSSVQTCSTVSQVRPQSVVLMSLLITILNTQPIVLDSQAPRWIQKATQSAEIVPSVNNLSLPVRRYLFNWIHRSTGTLVQILAGEELCLSACLSVYPLVCLSVSLYLLIMFSPSPLAPQWCVFSWASSSRPCF